MTEMVFMWDGNRVEDLSKEELIEVVKALAEDNEFLRERLKGAHQLIQIVQKVSR